MKLVNLTNLLDYSKLKFRIRRTMRYDDVGDYQDNTIIAYDMKNPVFNNAIMLHEFIEYSLLKSAGVAPELIDAFDTTDEAPAAYPEEYKLYVKYHRIANNVERHLIENMGYTWKEYHDAVYNVKVKIRPGKKKRLAATAERFKVR